MALSEPRTVTAQRVYLLYGEDTFSRDEQVRSLKTRMLADEAGAFNLSEFDGPGLSSRALIQTCDSVPFLSDRRLVILRGLHAAPARAAAGRRAADRAGGSSQEPPLAAERAAFLEYLPRLPEFTAVVLVEGRLSDRQLEAVRGAVPAGRLLERAFPLPRPDALPGWIAARARKRGGTLGRGVAQRLAELGVNELALIDSELTKLMTYRAGDTIELEDVELLAVAGELSHFRLLDAILAGNRTQALEHWRQLLRQGMRPEALLPLIAGSLRVVLVAAEARAAGESLAAIAGAHGIVPTRVQHLQRQAARFRPRDLQDALSWLLDLDRRVKRGEADLEVGLELLVERLAGLAAR